MAWNVWPRAEPALPLTRAGDHALGPLIRIAEDGRITLLTGQSEMGQGVLTTHAQIVADELGADWRTVGVEPAHGGDAAGNALWLSEELAARGVRAWREAPAPMVTGGSTSVRGFEATLRRAAATARTLLCMAAAKRWDADWRACETADGFVTRGNDRARFGTLAADAAALTPPAEVPLRTGRTGRLVPRSLPRLDAPAKIDGSARFVADVRLPELLFATIAKGDRIDGHDRNAALGVPNVVRVIADGGSIAVVARNSFAAQEGMRAAAVRLGVAGRDDDAGLARALDAALARDGVREVAIGAQDDAPGRAFTATYRTGAAPFANLEPTASTARLRDGTLECWVATQAPEAVRASVAAATGHPADAIVIHPMLIGGSFGRRYHDDAAADAARLAITLRRPVQLCWSRAQEQALSPVRAPVAARMAARLAGPRIAAWTAKVASAPVTMARAATFDPATAPTGAPGDITGWTPPYAIPATAIDRHTAPLRLRVGTWRGGPLVEACFATESFIDELAAQAATDPFSFRMGMLSHDARAARCLARVATLGEWTGGTAGGNQGIAVASLHGSRIAVIASLSDAGGGRRVERLVAVADVGRVVNPAIVRQQIAGGLCYGTAAALGAPFTMVSGRPTARRYADLKPLSLATAPAIVIELLQSAAPPGGAGELGVPVAAPAIANALFAATGRRQRTLPLL